MKQASSTKSDTSYSQSWNIKENQSFVVGYKQDVVVIISLQRSRESIRVYTTSIKHISNVRYVFQTISSRLIKGVLWQLR